MIPDRKTSREDRIQEMMESGGNLLKEIIDDKKMAKETREILLTPDFKTEDLDERQKRFIRHELEKLSNMLHKENHPNHRLNQVLEGGDLNQMILFARDYMTSTLKGFESENVIPIEKIA